MALQEDMSELSTRLETLKTPADRAKDAHMKKPSALVRQMAPSQV
ncbi:hypothetical protein [Limnohabitans sp. 2KL-27]|nr:hypothetical protein [Limnohabitans sp. 2KL-27]